MSKLVSVLIIVVCMKIRTSYYSNVTECVWLDSSEAPIYVLIINYVDKHR